MKYFTYIEPIFQSNFPLCMVCKHLHMLACTHYLAHRRPQNILYLLHINLGTYKYNFFRITLFWPRRFTRIIALISRSFDFKILPKTEFPNGKSFGFSFNQAWLCIILKIQNKWTCHGLFFRKKSEKYSSNQDIFS